MMRALYPLVAAWVALTLPGCGSPTDEVETDTDTDTDGVCDDLTLCDDFEDSTPNADPDPEHWSIVTPNCSGDGQLTVDNEHARSGEHSVRVSGSGGYCNHIFMAPTANVAALGPVVHGRFWIRFDNAFGWEHVTFLAMKDEIENKDVRMGGQSQILMWNRESDDATLPALSPTGISMSVAPEPDQWMCIQFAIDEENGTLETWVDNEWVEGLIVDGTSTFDVDEQWLRKPDWRPSLVDIKLGWEAYGGGSNTVWFDDVAFDSKSIPCD